MPVDLSPPQSSFPLTTPPPGQGNLNNRAEPNTENNNGTNPVPSTTTTTPSPIEQAAQEAATVLEELSPTGTTGVPENPPADDTNALLDAAQAARPAPLETSDDESDNPLHNIREQQRNLQQVFNSVGRSNDFPPIVDTNA